MPEVTDAPRYFFRLRDQRVNGVFRLGPGRRVFRVLATFAEVHLDAQGEPLPDWTDAQRDAFLGPRWHAAREALAVTTARVQASGLAGALWADFIAAARADRAPGTVALYEEARAAYLAANADHPLADFTLHHVDRLKTLCLARMNRPATINRHLNGLRAFLRWAHDRKEITERPRFPNVDAPRPDPKVLTATELQRLLARVARLAHAGDPRQRPHYRHHLRFLMLGLGCGLRRGEILNLRWDQVDLDAGHLVVGVTRTFRPKNKAKRPVPMPAFLCGFLRHEAAAKPKREEWLLDDGQGKRAYAGRHGAHSLTTAFRKHLAAIGCAGKGIKPTHGQRAMFATELHRRGADAYTIQQLMGHSSITVTEHYLADPGHAKRRAIDSLTLPRVARKPPAPEPPAARKRVGRIVGKRGKSLM